MMKNQQIDKNVMADQIICDYCGVCVGICPENCIELNTSEITIIHSECTRCGFCIAICPVKALSMDNDDNS